MGAKAINLTEKSLIVGEASNISLFWLLIINEDDGRQQPS